MDLKTFAKRLGLPQDAPAVAILTHLAVFRSAVEAAGGTVRFGRPILDQLEMVSGVTLCSIEASILWENARSQGRLF